MRAREGHPLLVTEKGEAAPGRWDQNERTQTDAASSRGSARNDRPGAIGTTRAVTVRDQASRRRWQVENKHAAGHHVLTRLGSENQTLYHPL
jgi:hypothetical protein